MSSALAAIRCWTSRQWGITVGVALIAATVIGIPTDLIPNSLFRRDVSPQWWAWPALLVSSLLMGMLTATYLAPPEATAQNPRSARQGTAAGVLTFFAVGCPVCNKIVLLALGYAGAISIFEPVQPFLQLLAVAMLLWALRARLTAQTQCPYPTGGGHQYGKSLK